ncbi:hypothetical protein [Rhodopseudomonas sp. BR0G17]|uniref:hypothetical protein n=1 Tax=Rhodopseudomonas sp. BR0G17 TaxID=2269368 RepID=UPI0013E03C58|nr:hypothetical protein [Rhodopseudomonas sp. BR0G17]NEW95512.1 hypothetical protein [Rhodopseudomonas sp. BR0G17]
MDYLINLGLGVLGSLLAAELVFRHKLWCTKIIRAASDRIADAPLRAIKLEEWNAALNETVGLTASFSHAIGCWIGAPAVAREAKLVTVSAEEKSAEENPTKSQQPEPRAWRIYNVIGVIIVCYKYSIRCAIDWIAREGRAIEGERGRGPGDDQER